jgi:hypothetical protein
MPEAKTIAIEQFEEMAYLERQVARVVADIMARSPRTLVIAWEDAEGTKATSIPFSANLVKGMVDTLYDMVHDEPETPDEPDEEID